jgi:hypothetical protein
VGVSNVEIKQSLPVVALALGLVLDVPHVRYDEDLPGAGVLPHFVIEPDHHVTVNLIR